MTSQKIPNQFWLIVTLALLTMVGPFTIDTYLPSFPTLEEFFHVDRILMSQSIAVYIFASALSTLIWGALSDSIGRKIVIYYTLALYIVASIGCAFSSDFSWFLFFRMLQGVAASGGMIVGRAIVRDSFDSSQAHRVMAYVMMVFALAPAVAPIIGGFLHDSFGWQSVFYFLAFYGIIVSILTNRILPETLKHEDKTSFHPVAVLKVYLLTLQNKRFQAIIFTVGISFAGLFLYVTGSPALIFDILKLDSSSFAYQFVPMTSGIVIGSFISGRLSHHLSSKQIVSIAQLVMVIACIFNVWQLYFMDVSIFSVVAPLALYAVGIAIQLPALSVLALDCFPHNRGAASAVQGFVHTMLATLITAIVVPIVASSLTGFVLTQVGVFAVALILWIMLCIRK